MLRKLLKVLGIILVVVVVAFTGMYFYLSRNLDELVESPIESFDVSSLESGTYVGEYSVPPVSATVEVRISDGRIDQILLLDHGNGMGQPAEAIIDDVIEKQSLQIDSISGATYSSRVILKAIEDALSKAR